jgi:hypothetical protein
VIGAAPSSWRALAVVEGRRLIRHPAFLAGVAFTLIGSVVFVRATLSGRVTTWDEDGWTAVVGFLLLAVLTMVAANLSALRDRREDTTEQHTALPVGRSTRTGALIAATLWPATAGAVLLGAVAGYAATRMPLTSTDQAHLLEAVAVVVMLGALGVALAAWLPSPFVAPAVAWGLLFLTPGDDPSRWFVLAPIADLRDPALSLVHLVYLLGLATVFGALAVARTNRSRPVILAGLAGGAVVVVAAAVLVSGVCSASGACVI